MAGDFDLKDESTTNSCCRVWEDRFLKLQQKAKKTEDARNALKKAVVIYEQQFDKMQNDSLKLKNAYEEEKLQTDHERKEKEKESTARVSLENEITALKAEILSLSQKGGSASENVSEELELLKGRVFDKEKEINCLQEEKNRATAEKSRIEQELSNLKIQLLNVETEKKKLMQDLQKEKKRADEKSTTAKTKQAEVEVLKAEKKNNDLCSLQSEKQNLETEIGRLKELLENERKRADCEAKKAETEKKNAHRVKEMLKAEQSRTGEQRKLVDVETKKIEEFELQLQRAKCEADEAKSKLVSEGLKFKEANKKLEAEKKKSIKEKKKAEEQQKIAEMSTKHALVEKHNAVRLQQQLEDCQNKYDKLKKDMENYEANMKIHGQVKQKTNPVRNNADLDKEIENKKAAEMYKLQAMKEKSRADKLAQQLEDAKKGTKNEHKVIQDLVSFENLSDTMKAKSAEMKLLKKRLKLEKARVKHYIQVAELEKKCKKTVEEELHRLKLEFTRFSSRVGLCSCFDICNVGKSCLEKNDNVNSKRKFLQTGSGKEPAKPTKPSEYFKPSLDVSAPSLPISGTCTESTSVGGGHTGKSTVAYFSVV
ncbi:hypothetical protein L1987_72717 [Smallanthus sonchifolius]|uniref:Uncharacterized protein n=1 Tax=Smallanthus sonchifolius TaxID=185202 RepID=A0ACB9AV62_9ASTR|nr:hypothetical protein L1987_72717 [Smallanthus sonchifolius]